MDAIKFAMAIATAIVGLVSLLLPETAGRFVGFSSLSKRGTAEMRAIFGGLFVGLGVAPILLGGGVVYKALGIGYLAVALARALSIFVLDKDRSPSNLLSLVWEAAFGVVLIIF